MAPGRPRSLRALTFGSAKREMSPGPPSPTFSDATHASAMNFGPNGPSKIITRGHLKASLQAYEDRQQDSRTRWKDAVGPKLRVRDSIASGVRSPPSNGKPLACFGTYIPLEIVIKDANVFQSETLDKNFEKPLRQQLENYRDVVNERSQRYERALRERSRIIRETETRSMNRKERNLKNFREALAVLQNQVDQLDQLKASHYQEIIEHEEEVWNVVQNKICVVVRSEMDVFDRFTSKASDPIIEPMLQSVPDPFDSYGPPPAEDQIFSILAPLDIMTTATSSTASPMTGSTPERDTLSSLPSSATMKITSWLPGANGSNYTPESQSAEWATVPSPSSSATPSRSTSPIPSSSPPSVSSRRHSVPAVHRKTESKLRSVLSVIEEAKPRPQTEERALSGPSPLPSVLTNISAPQNPDTTPVDVGWNFTYGQSNYDHSGGQLTPRYSTLFSQSSPPSLPDSPPTQTLERHGHDGQTHAESVTT
ncbi:hypothetical protein JR316_0004715 [Psilocybe cubensis]|uniref:Uncharacterized protein n=1 Tax=Psilocybe cubensis TaxID=181762 RepID=A0ACB8H601_PSICU|nr:hypothetical protein JR316_0004715 [Psilocybe cubensis]KAH9482615.1 hypothetical protein JR316_0004715 [Psilocybe cubensis]